MRAEVGCSFVFVSLLAVACGESSSSEDDAASGGSVSSGGSSGAAATGGSSGDAASGGSSGDATGGGSSGTAGAANGLVPYYQPGTRLKPKVLSAGPGLDLIEGFVGAGWYDTELDMDCYFRVGTDGVERCYPPSTTSSLMYSDASCSDPVLRTGPILPCGRESLRYMFVGGGPESCVEAAFHLGAELPISTPLYENPNGTCQPVTLPAPDDPILWELEAVPMERFVALHYATRPRQAGMDAYVREGDDGSWQVVAFSDPATGPCADLTPVVVSPPRCLPIWTIWTGAFGDAACEVPVAEVAMPDVCAPPTPKVIMRLEYDPDSCPLAQGYELWEIAEVRESTPYSDDGSGMCVARPDGQGEVYVAGAPIDVATLPAIDHLEVGTGPLKGPFRGFGGVPYLPEGRYPWLVESETGEACRPANFEDGTLRCLPESVPGAREGEFYYESSSCSGARVVLQSRGEPCLPAPAAPRAAVIAATDSVCSTNVIVDTVAITGVSSASTLYGTNPETGACEGFDRSSIVDGEAYLIGESVDPADFFVEVEIVLRE